MISNKFQECYQDSNAIPLFLLSLAKVYHIFLYLSRVFQKIRLYKIVQKTMTKDINFLISQRGALRLGGYMSILYIYLYIVYYIQDEGQVKKSLKTSGV